MIEEALKERKTEKKNAAGDCVAWADSPRSHHSEEWEEDWGWGGETSFKNDKAIIRLEGD